MYYHAIAVLAGGRKKSIVNKTEDQILTQIVLPYVTDGLVKVRWGSSTQSYQVIDLRIYKTKNAWYKKGGILLDNFIAKSKNVYSRFERRAKSILSKGTFRVFVIMPIQGEKFGTQDDQRIYKEFDGRFEALEKLLSKYNCVPIRIDKEHPIEELVRRIKEEIRKAHFVIADVTEERPSCYFEAGYADALAKPIIYIGSKESVMNPRIPTKVHFDIHMHVNFFVNHNDMVEKVKNVIEKNKQKLFAEQREFQPVALQ
jgi:nucleoside 2-deoxyribosyltransferase